MFRFLSRHPHPVELSGERHLLRPPRFDDYPQWRDLRAQSRDFLQPWEPAWTADELTGTSFRERVRRYEQEFARGHAISLFLFERGEERLLGGLTIGLIRRGVAQSCMIGYWVGKPHAGQGHMFAAVRLVMPYIFTGLQLHRIEAACIPENERSIRLLQKAGFQREGFLREYLKINGVWRDHIMFSRLASDQDAEGTR